MEALIKDLVAKLGLNQGVAEKAATVIQENVANVPKLLSDNPQGVTQLLEKTGIEKSQAEKVVTFLKDNAANLPQLLGSEGGGILEKGKEMLGGVLGGKESK